MWARRVEREIDVGRKPTPKAVQDIRNFADLIDLHIADVKAVGRAPGRSKAGSLEMLRNKLGRIRLPDLDREALIKFGRERAAEGAGPVTIGIDLGYVKTILTHGAAVHGLPFSPEPVDLARVALKLLGLVGKGNERDRRPTESELNALFSYFSEDDRSSIPMGRVIRFAIATAMRQDEIFRCEWEDVDASRRTLLIRDRKDPRNKNGNDQRIALLKVSGYDAWALLQEQFKATAHRRGRIFPYNGKSAGAAFRRACRRLGIEDLHFHDLRHEATSRLFEAGFKIQEAALVTGHKDWKMLQRYTHLPPENLHVIAASLSSMRPAGFEFPSDRLDDKD